MSGGDDTSRLLERIAVNLEHHAEVMLAGGNALKAGGQTIAADSAFTVHAAWQSVADALNEIAVAPADQRVLLADGLAFPGPGDVGDQVLARPLLEVVR